MKEVPQLASAMLTLAFAAARIVSFREGMRSSQDYFWLFDLEGRGDDHFPSPINNGRFIEMPVEVRFGRSPG
jgi:hypothetical protein